MKYIEDNYENMLNDLKRLVKYNSVLCDDEKPFGSQNRKVLDEAISLMNEKGFNTKNVDYYACYGEVGQGDKTIGVVCHLDIVPAGEGWDSNPFEVVQKGDRLYGRGVSDDKGAAVASMYAIKYLLDTNYQFKKKVRLILGCNEETGSKCIKHYVEKEGGVDMGFTPDGEFPGIYAEKGMISGVFKAKSKIVNIKGGEASNIVCKKVECELPVNSYDANKFKKYLDDNNIKYEINGNSVTVFGIAAHASAPDSGVNAMNYLMEALYNADFGDEYVDLYHKYIGLDVHGEKFGMLPLKDDETDTSVNIGVIKKEGDYVLASVDMRFPITRTVDDCKKILENIEPLEIKNMINPLYFEKDSPMIKAMLKAYRDVTGDNGDMIAIGGGTYAKSIKNIIAFGCAFNEEENHIHDANESLGIEDFKKQVEIYIEAIKNLNEV